MKEIILQLVEDDLIVGMTNLQLLINLLLWEEESMQFNRLIAKDCE